MASSKRPHLTIVGNQNVKKKSRAKEIDDSVANHPAGSKLSKEQKAALEDAEKWSMRIEVARDGYEVALERCRRLHLSNATIAIRVRKTEAAIRMHFARRR